MFKNYITVALRNLLRQKRYALINIFGLALGIACCLLIFLLVQEEWSYDRYHTKKDQIYRVIVREHRTDGEIKFSVLQPFELAQAFEQSMPGVVRASGYMRAQGNVTYGEKTSWRTFGLIDPAYLHMFTIPILTGDPNTALNDPNAIIISQATANRYFDDIAPDYSNLLGRALTFHGASEPQDFVISAVMKNVPRTSSMRVDLLVNNKNYQNFHRSDDWGGHTSIYIELTQNQTAANITKTLPTFTKEHAHKRIQEFREEGRIIASDEGYQLHLQPLTNVYQNTDIRNTYEARGNIQNVYTLAIIAFVILALACINFTTLSIGRSTSRALEVGMRKVLGAYRSQLMGQFWGEAILMTFFALIIGLAFTELFLPQFNTLAQKQLTLSFTNSNVWVGLLLILICVGIIAGAYPAFILSRIHPIQSLKGRTTFGGRNRITRTLIIIQYALSIGLMTSTGIMYQQLDYMHNKNLGFDTEQVAVVEVPGGNASEIADRYKAALQSASGIIGITTSDRTFTSGSSATGYRDKNGKLHFIRQLRIDNDYLTTLKIPLLTGRDYDPSRPSDEKQSILVNETLAKTLAFENPVGQIFAGWGGDAFNNPTIIGVVKDFHFDRLHTEIQPLVLYTNPTGNERRAVFIRIRPEQSAKTLAHLEEVWNTVAPDRQYRLRFLDDNLNKQYHNEERWNQIISYGTLFAILISCLGLLGLASLSVARRTKEIGIRKVLGASVPNLVNLLSIDFIKLLLIANIIAWPIAYYAMNKWLTNFAYHIELGISIFVISGTLALFVALLTVGTQTFKAARSNPVDALRYE